jgi:hypothetical protein
VLDYIVIVPKMTKTFHCWASLAKTKVSDWRKAWKLNLCLSKMRPSFEVRSLITNAAGWLMERWYCAPKARGKEL